MHVLCKQSAEQMPYFRYLYQRFIEYPTFFYTDIENIA